MERINVNEIMSRYEEAEKQIVFAYVMQGYSFIDARKIAAAGQRVIRSTLEYANELLNTIDMKKATIDGYTRLVKIEMERQANELLAPMMETSLYQRELASMLTMFDVMSCAWA